MIGGSVARAAKKRGLVREVLGVDRSPLALKEALELGAIDTAAHQIDRRLEACDLVVIATPVGTFQELLSELKPHWNQETLYTDVGSTKRSVVWAAERVFGRLPGNFIPAHPIAGREKPGVLASDPDLFEGKRVILTPLLESDLKFLERARRFWEALGAEVHDMSPAHHDHVLAATSHLPHLLAYALTHLLGRKDEKDEIFKFAAGGFRDFSRIASSCARMWRDIVLANRDELLPLLDQLLEELHEVRRKVAGGEGEALERYFSEARLARERFLKVYEGKSRQDARRARDRLAESIEERKLDRQDT